MYALGVLLYELLAGSPPFALKELEKKGLLEILRVVRDEEPPRPSTKLSTNERVADAFGQPRHRADEVDGPAAERTRLDRDEGAGEGPHSEVRDGQRVRGRCAAVPVAARAVQAHPPSMTYRLPGSSGPGGTRARCSRPASCCSRSLGGIVGHPPLGLIEAREQKQEAKTHEQEAKTQEKIAREEPIEKEKARAASAERVKERDAALKAEGERADELRYRLGVNAMVLANTAYDSRDYKLTAERLDNVPQEQRGWEWRYLQRQLKGGIFTLHAHRGPVTCVAFSPDGTRFVTGGGHYNAPFEAKVWDARTGMYLFDLKGLPQKLQGINTIPYAVSVAFSPDSKRIVTAGTDKTARVYDATTGAPQLQLTEPTGVLKCAAFSPDGTQIATAGDWGLVKMWDAQDGEAPARLEIASVGSHAPCVQPGRYSDPHRRSPPGGESMGCADGNAPARRERHDE